MYTGQQSFRIMKNYRIFINLQILALLFSIINSSNAQSVDDIGSKLEKRSHTFQKTTLPYRIFIPENYDATQSYPLMLCLHGAGERGSDNEIQISHHGLAISWTENLIQSQHPCFVVVPQCPVKKRWNYVDFGKGSFNMDTVAVGIELLTVINLLDSLLKEFNIDQNRQYVTGLSMGGYGTWDIISRYPERFAAAIPMSGAGDPSKVERFKHIPIWSFHNSGDKIVPVEGSRDMTEAMIRSGLEVIQTLGMPDNILESHISENVQHLYTESPKGNHGPWEQWYGSAKLHKWVFSRSK